MAEVQDPNQQIQFLLGDFNTRLRDLEERNHLIKDRTLLLGKNLVATKEQSSEGIQELKSNIAKIQRELEHLKKLSKELVSQTGKFVKRDEVAVIERMLKDFQPLEFMRKKDVEELIKQKSKTTKTKKALVKK